MTGRAASGVFFSILAIASGCSGSDLAGTCDAWCTPGETSCEGDGVVTCEQPAADCLAWSEPVACGGATPFCSLGACAADCVDECTTGETRCSGPTSVQDCGQADSDTCNDWLAAETCAGAETCGAGVCGVGCGDACSAGATRCSGDGVETCGDLDGDGCTEWGASMACPAGGTCTDGACACVAACEPAAFGAGDGPAHVAVDATHVYWTAYDAGVIFRRAHTGGVQDTLATGQNMPSAIAVDASGVYWTNYGNGTIGRWTPAGGAVVFASGQLAPFGIALDATHVYWTDETFARVNRCEKESCTPSVVAMSSGRPRHVALDATHVYWTANGDGMAMGNVQRAPKVGGMAEMLATGQTGTRGIALDATHVYWTASEANRVMRALKTGGTVEQVATAESRPNGVLVEGDYVYWTNSFGGEIRRRAKSGGGVETIATDPNRPQGIAMSSDYVYWASYAADELMQLSRCACGL